MTVEAPRGVKANLLRSFGSGGTGVVTEKLYEETCPDKPGWKNLLFGLCFFNAILHERKKYGRLGWNIPYEFNDSDLEVSVLQLEMLLSEQEEIIWPALWYLTGEVTYGGRVTDDLDRRCLHSLLQKFYHPRALKQGYSYSPDEVYHPLPRGFGFTDAKTYIECLPNQDSPELFGMNDNAEKAYRESQAQELVETVLSVQPRVSEALIGTLKSNDEVVLEMTGDILCQLPSTVDQEDEDDRRPGQPVRPTLADILAISTGAFFNKDRRRDSMQKDSRKTLTVEDSSSAVEQLLTVSSSALFTVLRQEIDRYNHLLSIIHLSLLALQRAVRGEVVMSQGLEEAYEALLHQRVPAEWKKASYESCKPLGAWVRDLLLRVDFFALWVEQVIKFAERALKPPSQQAQQVQQAHSPSEDLLESNRTQPRSFWLSGFFFPHGFLTAVLQNHARKLGVSVDSLSFEFRVQQESGLTDDMLNDIKHNINIKEKGFKGPSPPVDGVLVFGLYLDGARWNIQTSSLCDSLPGQRFSELPEIHFIPVSEMSRPSTASQLESPMAMFKHNDPQGKGVKDTYECPLYRTSARAGTLSSTGHSTNFITSVQLPTDHPAEFWVMRGVALLCQLDD